MMKEEPVSEPSESTAGPAELRSQNPGFFARDRRRILLALAAAFFLAGTAMAIHQGPWPDPLRPPPFWKAGFYPVEFNGDLRLPATDGHFRTIFALDVKHIWAAGDGGLLIYTLDGGLSWQQGTFLPSAAPVPTESSRRSSLPQSDRIDVLSSAATRSIAPSNVVEDWLLPSNAFAEAPSEDIRRSMGESSSGAPSESKPSAASKAQEEKRSEVRKNLSSSPAYRRALQIQEKNKALRRKEADSGVPIDSPPESPASAENEEAPAVVVTPPNLVPTDLPPSILDITFLDENNGWAAGSGIFRSKDGGKSWTRQSAAQSFAVVFMDPSNGWAVLESSLLVTRDGGDHWEDTGSSSDPRFLTAMRERHGARSWHGPLPTWPTGSAAQGDGMPRQARRGLSCCNTSRCIGMTPIPEVGDPTMGLSRAVAVACPDPAPVLVVGIPQANDAAVFVNIPDDRSAPRTSPIEKVTSLDAVQFLDRERGWVAGVDGVLLATSNGGKSWTAMTRGTRRVADGRSEYFDPRLGAKLAPALRDPESRHYFSIPSPLCFALWIIAALLTIAAARAPAPVAMVNGVGTVADLLAPDRPLRPGDADVLQMGDVVAALSSFIRNPKTEPSVTIGVVGEWGTGKSSIMGLLKSDLEKRDFRPVWFNAWHHQTGEQILASFFANLREQGVPSFFSLAGIEFYVRLASARLRSRWLAVLILFTMIFLSWGFIAHNYSALFSDPGSSSEGLLDSLLSMRVDGLAGVIPLSGTILPLVALVRLMRAFDVRASALMNEAEQSLRAVRADTKPGARFDFAQQFAEVTDALGDYPLVIFIDDLDRCDQSHLIEVLEMVNFLACSGRCFIILGFDRGWVERCVGLHYRALAEGEQGNNSEAKVQAFARRYLEKLINLEVPVPRPPDMAMRLLERPAPSQQPVDTAGPRVPHWFKGLVATTAAMGVLALASLIGSGIDVTPPAKKPRPDFRNCVATALRSQVDHTTSPTSVNWECVSEFLAQANGVAIDRAPESAGKPADDAPFPQLPVGEPGRSELSEKVVIPTVVAAAVLAPKTPLEIAVTIFAAMLMIIPVLWWRREDPRTRDSPAFESALQVWQPVIAMGHATPRSVKRFLNRVRYLALRVGRRDEGNPTNPGGASAGNAVGPKPEPNAGQSRELLTEPSLVGLASLHALAPNLLGDPLSAGEKYDPKKVPADQDAIDRVRGVLKKCLDSHKRKYPGQSLGDSEIIDQFRKALGEVGPS